MTSQMMNHLKMMPSHILGVWGFLHREVCWYITISHKDITIEGTSFASPHFEDGVAFAAEKLVKVSLGSSNDPCLTFLGTGLDAIERRNIFYLLHNYRDCFS